MIHNWLGGIWLSKCHHYNQRRSCMLNLVRDNITPEDNNKSSVKKLPTIICSKMQWKNMDKEEAIKKDCAERLSKPLGNNSKYVWIGIGVATMRS